MTISSSEIKDLARSCGFELAGVTAAATVPEYAHFCQWTQRDLAGEMGYLTDHRAALREDPRQLLPSARSIICVGKLYNTAQPYSTNVKHPLAGWISRYAWGADYHDILRDGLTRLARTLEERCGAFDHRISVDTLPLLERAYAHHAGLGWLGKNTCLINEPQGSWFFLGALLTSLDLEPDSPPPNRCGSCTRCIDACPTAALVERDGRWELDARLCISYLTIELRGAQPEAERPAMGRHVFGCDICQDVCPWNRRAPVSDEASFGPRYAVEPPLATLADLTEEEFRAMFRRSPVWRARYRGFLRNVAIAMGNSAAARFRAPLERLAAHADPLVADAAQWALARVAPLTSGE